MVKRIVKNHSSEVNSLPYSALNDETLSSITTITLMIIAIIKATSKNFPAFVSASKIISCNFLRHPDSDSFSSILSDNLFN